MNSDRAPLRIRYKLDGYDDGWREVAGEMRLSVRFFNDSGRATYGVRLRSREKMVVRIFDGRLGLGSAVRIALSSAMAQIARP